MADEMMPEDIPQPEAVEVGKVDLQPKSLGRGMISAGDYVSFVGDDGVEQFGTVVGLVMGDVGWLLQVLPDGADMPVDLERAAVTKAKRPVAAPVEAPAEMPVGPNTDVVEQMMGGRRRRSFARGAPIRAEGGRFGGSEPGDGESSGDSAGADPAAATEAFNSGDRAAEGAGPVVNDSSYNPAVDEALEVGLTGPDAGMDGTTGAMLDTLVEQGAFQPTTGEVVVMSGTHGASVDPETLEVSGGPLGGTPDIQGTVAAGDSREVLGESKWATYDESRGSEMPMEITIPEGHPVVNLGSRGDGTEALAGEDNYGYQSTMVMYHPDTVFTPTGVTTDEVTGMNVVQVVASMPSGGGTAEASVTSPNAKAVEQLMTRFITEFGRFIQGPDGRLMGSESESGGPVDGPEDPIGGGPADPLGPLGGKRPSAAEWNRTREYPFGDRDKAGTLDAAGDWDKFDQGAGGFKDFETAEASTVESVFLNGGEIVAAYTQVTEDGGMGMMPIDEMGEQQAESAYETVADMMDELATPLPAGEEIAITTTVSLGQYEFNPETGMLSGKYGEQDTLPIGSTPPVIVGYGNPTAAVAEAAATGDMPVQIVVTEGTPIINGGVGQVADKSAGTAVALPSSAKVTITGQTIDPFGQPMLLATATPYEPGEARWR